MNQSRSRRSWLELRAGRSPRPRTETDAPDSLLPTGYEPLADEHLTVAAQLLAGHSALAELDAHEAEFIISYTHERRYAAGEVVIAEGDRESTGYMLLILDGDVTVETVVVSRTEPIIVSAVGAGSLIGEMGLLDGAPRAASCVAATDVRAAVLTREALAQLVLDDPFIGAKLLASISQRLAERLRESGRKLRAYSQLVRAMQDEIETLDPTPGQYKIERR